MKKEAINILSILLIIIAFTSLVSAGWFSNFMSDFFGEITGYATENETIESCTDECSQGAKECSGNNYRTCGNYDSDSCLEWNSYSTCGSEQICESGTCKINPTSEKKIPCTEDDGGLNFGRKDYYNSSTGSATDTCNGNTLTEYYCVDDKLLEFIYTCPIRCVDGACRNLECVDSDGGINYNVGGRAQNWPDKYTEDICNGKFLREAYCVGDLIEFKYFTCPEKCAWDSNTDKGYACTKLEEGETPLPTCLDSDGGIEIYVGGKTQTEPTRYQEDYCVKGTGNQATKIYEKYCTENDKIETAVFDCPNGCIWDRNGWKCINSEDTEEKTCTDSDGGQDSKIKGSTCLGNNCVSDTCLNNGKLQEYYCNGNIIGSNNLSCSSGYSCANGSCINLEPTNPKPNETTKTCSDSDGGNNIDRKGKTCIENDCFTDFCTSNFITEFYCSNNKIISINITCTSGFQCSSGVCLKIIQINESISSSGNEGATEGGGEDFTSSIPSNAKTTRIEGITKEGKTVITESIEFIDKSGNDVNVDSSTTKNIDGSSIKEEERKFKDARGNELIVKVKTQIKNDGSIVTDREFINIDGKLVEIKVTKEINGNVTIITRKFKVQNTEVNTKLNILEELDKGKLKIIADLSNGNKQDINVMPDKAEEIASKNLGFENFIIELEEIEERNIIKAIYRAKSNEEGKLFGFFKVKVVSEAQIDSETGHIINVKIPWWNFIVTRQKN